MIIFFVLLLCFLIVLLKYPWNKYARGKESFTKFGGCALFLFSIFCMNEVFLHSSQIAFVRMSSDHIIVHQEAIDEVDRQMKSISIPEHSFFNADSPYRSLIELRGQRIHALAETKVLINKAKSGIIARKVGLFRDIVYIFGEE